MGDKTARDTWTTLTHEEKTCILDEQISNPETLDITGFGAMADFLSQSLTTSFFSSLPCLTHDEQQILAIFNAGNRESTMTHISEMLPDIDPEETELRELVESAVAKLHTMTDDEFDELDLELDF